MLSLFMAATIVLSRGEVLFLKESFEHVKTGSIPAGFAIAETNGAGKPAHWEVVEDASRQIAGDDRILRLMASENTDQTYNLLLSDAAFPADLEISFHLRADGGEEDRGGGFAWQVQDEDNYFVTRWNPLEDNLRIYRVAEGKRTVLHGIDIARAHEGWHSIDIRVKGDIIEVSLDDAVTIACTAEPFSGGGRVGFWTKADATTSFDGLRVRKL